MIQRCLFSLAGLAGAVLTLANVTFETRATTVAQALAACGKANNLDLTCGGPIAKQVVVVSIKDQPLEVFLKKFAEATSGAWNINNGKYELVLSPSAVKVEEEAEIARRAKGFAKSIAEQTKTLDANSVSENELFKRLNDMKALMDQIQSGSEDQNQELYDKSSRLQDLMPTQQLLKRIAASFAPQELAALPADSRLVYATDPTRMQKPLNQPSQRAFSAFAQDFARMAAAVNRFPKEQRDTFLSMLSASSMSGAPSKVIVGFTRYGGDSLSIDLQVLDRNSQVLCNGSMNLGATEFAMDSDGKVDQTKTPAQEKPIKVSDESRTYYQMISRNADSVKGAFEMLQEPLKGKVLNPETTDPLSYGITDLFLAAAAQKGKPLVALIPDEAYLFDCGNNLTPDQFISQLEDASWMKVADSDGWLIGRPLHPAEARLQRLDRIAYGKLIRGIAEARQVNLTMLANFAIAQGVNPGYDGFYVQSLYALFGPMLAGYDLSAWETMRFFGFLGESGRKNLAANPAAYSNLPKDCQNELARIIYKLPSLSIPGEAFDVPTEVPTSNQVPEDPGGYCTDPTERLPNGIPANTLVKLNISQESVVIPQASYMFPLGAAELASQLAMEERPDLFPWAQEAKLPDRFRMATRVFYDFSFKFNPITAHNLQLWDFTAANQQLYARSQLPASFKDEVEKQLKDMREAYKGMKNENRGGGGSPPPAP